MRVTYYPDGGGAVRLTLDGELDIATVELLARHVDRALITRPRRLALDMGGVTVCDSTGIGALVEARAAALARGAQFGVVNARGITRRTMEIIGVLELLTGASAQPA